MLTPPSIPGFSHLELLKTTSRYTLWTAQQDALNRPVLIQAIRPEAYSPTRLSQIFSTARQIATIKSRHIPQILDIVEGVEPAIVLEIGRGQSLADTLSNPQVPMPLSQALPILKGIAEEFIVIASKTNLVLRNLMPDVIWINSNNGAMAWDFTMALEAAESINEETLEGHPGSIAPEFLVNHPFDTRSDMYAFGALAFKLLVGADAFAGSSPESIIQRQLTKNPPPPSRFNSTLTPAVDEFILRLMAHDPEERYMNWGQIFFALNEFTPVEAPAPEAPQPAQEVEPTVAPKRKIKVKANATPKPRTKHHSPVPVTPLTAWAILLLALIGIGTYRWHTVVPTPPPERSIALVEKPTLPPAQPVQQEAPATSEPTPAPVPDESVAEKPTLAPQKVATEPSAAILAQLYDALHAPDPIQALNQTLRNTSEDLSSLRIKPEQPIVNLDTLFSQTLARRKGQTIELLYKGRKRTVKILSVNGSQIELERNGKSGTIDLRTPHIPATERLSQIGIPKNANCALATLAYSIKLNQPEVAKTVLKIYPPLRRIYEAK